MARTCDFDLSVSHTKLGDVEFAAGKQEGAQRTYEQALRIAERLAKADPSNSEWQRDLIVSCVKLSEVTGDMAYVAQALAAVLAMQQRGTLTPRDTWMVDELRRRAGQ